MTVFGWYEITCYKCKVPFQIAEGHYTRLKASEETFYCPNGHPQHFCESEATLLRRERDRLKQQLAQRDDALTHRREQQAQTERKLAATKGVVTRLRNRVGAGVCPCCTRSFENLARHMQTRHPDFRVESAE